METPLNAQATSQKLAKATDKTALPLARGVLRSLLFQTFSQKITKATKRGNEPACVGLLRSLCCLLFHGLASAR